MRASHTAADWDESGDKGPWEASQPGTRINCRARQVGYLRIRQAATQERVMEWDVLGGIGSGRNRVS